MDPTSLRGILARAATRAFRGDEVVSGLFRRAQDAESKAQALLRKSDQAGALLAQAEAVEIFRHIRRSFGEQPWVLHNLTIATAVYGEMLSNQDQTNEAVEAFAEAVDTARLALGPGGDDPALERIQLLAWALRMRANTYHRWKRFDEEVRDRSEEAALRRTLLELEQSAAAAQALTASLDALGDAFDARGDQERALEAFIECRESAAQYIGRWGESEDALIDLGLANFSMGQQLWADDRDEEAAAAFAGAIETQRRLLSRFGTTQSRRGSLAMLLWYHGASIRPSNRDAARASLEESVAIRSKLCTEEPTPEHLEDLAESLASLGSLESDDENHARAADLVSRALEFAARRYEAKSEDLRAAWDWAGIQMELGSTLLRSGKTELAVQHLRAGLHEAERIFPMAGDSPSRRLYLETIDWGYSQLSEALAQQGDVAAALETCRASVDAARQLVADHPDDPGCLECLIGSLEQTADLADRADNTSTAAVARDELESVQNRLARLGRLES